MIKGEPASDQTRHIPKNRTYAQSSSGGTNGQRDHRADDQIDHAAAVHARVRPPGGLQDERGARAPHATALHLPGEPDQHLVCRHRRLHAHELQEDRRGARLLAQRLVRSLRSLVREGRLREDQHSRRLLLLCQRLSQWP